jgi:hypothetical protein
MINPQKGIDLMNNTSIIIRILFAVTIFQQKSLSTLFPGWDFLGLDARGRSGGLAIGWCSRKINPLNSWASQLMSGA